MAIGNKYIFDAATSFWAADTVEATGYGDVIDINATPFHPDNKVGSGDHAYDMDCIVHTTAVDVDGGSITLSLETDSASTFGSATTVHSETITATGLKVIPISLERVKIMDSTARYMRAKLTFAGGSGDETVTLSAWLTKK